ncbi:MAG: trigger factor [Oscillospiraceae bacterium]|nr:trigger factor [Oscillospiraceae bacterium]
MELTKQEKLENGKLNFTVSIDAQAFEKAINGAYLKAKKNIFIPGFRKGKAPRAVVEGMYGKEVFYEDAIDEIAPDAYAENIEKTGERVVGRPGIKDFKVNDDKSVELTYEVALWPEAELGQYKGVEVVKTPVVVTDDMVNLEIESVRKRNGRIITVDRAAKLGDTVNIDYDGYLDGERFDGGKAENHDLVLGSNAFVPGFEAQLIGAVAGDEKDLDITFPENYHEGLAGKAVVFKVKVNEVKENELPALDDEFAKDVSEFDTLDEYVADVRKNLTASREAEADLNFREMVLEAAAANMTVTIPDEMIDERVDRLVDDYNQNLMMQGMDLQSYLGYMNMEMNTFRGYMRPNAESQVKAEIFLDKVAQVEGIEISEEEIEAEYASAAEKYGMEIDKIKAAVNSGAIVTDLKLKKATEIVVSNAVATEPKEEEAKEEAAE